MLRYQTSDEDLEKVFYYILAERFPQYNYLKFKLVYDLKKKVSGGAMVLACIELASAKIKFFTTDNTAEEGYDYILFVDKRAWDLASLKDKQRIISHELQHIYIDEKDKAKIVGHEIEDFYQEIKRNEDDPEWARKLVRLTTDVYDQEQETEKAKKLLDKTNKGN
jgi:hypothetical protein